MSDNLKDKLSAQAFKRQLDRLGIKTTKDIPKTVERESRFIRSLKMTIAQTKYVFRKG